jgi:hypothetical protein
MISVQVGGQDIISKQLRSIQDQLKALPPRAHREFVALTPIARVNGGNARRNTRLQNSTIIADYPYAQRLDDGYSRQAPQGMTRPWEVWMAKTIKTIFGK